MRGKWQVLEEARPHAGLARDDQRDWPETPSPGAPVRSPVRSSCYFDGARATDEVILLLHGDVDASSVPNLEAVLDGLVLLQPVRLVVDLSEVGRVNGEALRMFDRCGHQIGGGLALRSPSPETRAELAILGRLELIERERAAPPG